MRLPWTKSEELQLDLLDTEPGTTAPLQSLEPAPRAVVPKLGGHDGRPMLVAVSMIYEDAHNPRTEFPEDSLAELAADLQQRGVLQPLVVHPAEGDGRHQVHFGAKRLRAAIRAGLHEVPVVVRDLPADRYAQVAENQKRHGLTAVAHHLSLLELPPMLDDALKSGRCTSPRTLHELRTLHTDSPDQVQALLASGAEITRTAVSAIRSASREAAPTVPTGSSPDKLIAQANAACDRLEHALSRIKPPDASSIAVHELIALGSRVEAITTRWLQGSDRQTPSQAER